jgi:hypothetical protein
MCDLSNCRVCLSATVSHHILNYPDAKGWKTTKIDQCILVLSPKLEFDTIKAQILKKISKGLKPKTIAFKHYSVAWTIPWTQASSMPLSSPADYQFLLDHASKQKTPLVNIMIKACPLKNKVHACFLSQCMHSHCHRKPSPWRRILRTQTRAEIVRVRIPTLVMKMTGQKRNRRLR